MQRRIQLLSDSKRSSRNGSPRSSHPSSNQPSRSSSRVRVQDEDDEDEYTSNAFLSPSLAGGDDELSQSIERLLLSTASSEEGEEGEESKVATVHRDKFSEGLEMLTLDRRNTSLEAREKALTDILSVISQKYEPQKINESVCNVLIKSYLTSRSELETLLAVQAIFVVAAADIDSCFESLTEQVLPKLFSQIKASIPTATTTATATTTSSGTTEKLSPTVIANLIIGYSLLQYVVHYGSGGYGVDEIVENLVDLAANCNNSDETGTASAAILGAGLLTTTVTNPNTIINDFIPVFIDYINNPSHAVKLAAAKIVALFYQIYIYEGVKGEDYLNEESGAQFDENDILEQIPNIDHNELEHLLKEQISESSKRIGKKDRRERKSLFRDVLTTVDCFSSPSKRDSITEEDLLITHLKLSRARSLSIDSWNKLLLIQHYKWAYGASIHTQIANNPFVRETVQESSYHGLSSGYSFSEGTSQPIIITTTKDEDGNIIEVPLDLRPEIRNQQAKATLDRQRQIKADRWEKQRNQGTISTI